MKRGTYDIEVLIDDRGINSIELALDMRDRPNGASNRRMEAMIVLRGEPEDRNGTAMILFDLVTIGFAKQTSNAELPAFDPETRSLVHSLKGHHAAISRAHKASRVIRGLDRPGFWLQFTVKELIEVFVLRDVLLKKFGHINLIGSYEGWD